MSFVRFTNLYVPCRTISATEHAWQASVQGVGKNRSEEKNRNEIRTILRFICHRSGRALGGRVCKGQPFRELHSGGYGAGRFYPARTGQLQGRMGWSGERRKNQHHQEWQNRCNGRGES